MAAQSHTATRDVMFSEPIEKIFFSPSLEHGGSESRGWGKRARRRVEMSLSVGYAYSDVTACGLRIQRRHCLWVTHTETSLPVGYEYRDVTACGLRIQRRHCLFFSHKQTSLPVSFCLTLLFETDEKDALLENDLREIIALISSECWMRWLLPLGSYYSLQLAECFGKQQNCVLIIQWKIGKFVFNRHISLHENH